MPSFEYDDVTIYYEEFGQGFPILTFAPGGLLSTIAFWSRPASPVNPTTAFADEFRVIAMDQRNAPDSLARRLRRKTAGIAMQPITSHCLITSASTSAISTASASAGRSFSAC